MKPFFVFAFLSAIAFAVSAQPANKVYWVGANIGADLASASWATSSGGLPGLYPANTNTQLIFDGGVTAGQTFFVNINTMTGGFFRVTNNTTVILQKNPAGSFFDLQNSGFSVDAGSKLVFENTGTGALLASVGGNFAYNSTVAGEMVLKAPIITCTQFYCAEVWLNLAGFATPFPPSKSLTVSGTLRMQGTKALINSGGGYLVFEANANFILDTDQATGGGASFDPTSTVTITGAGKGTATVPASAYLSGNKSYGNIVYDCPAQTNTRSIFSGSGWTVNGNLTVKNTGSGKVTLSGGTVVKDLILQGSPTLQNGSDTVNGNVDIQGGQFDLTGDVELKGSLTNQGVIKSTTGVDGNIKCTGAFPQTVLPGLIGDEPISFTINNPAGVVINGAWTLPSHADAKLILINGNVYMGTNTLTLQNPSPGTVAGGTASSHIIGKLRRATNTAGGSYVFPVSASATESANVKLSPLSSDLTAYEVSFSRPSPYAQTAVPAGVKNAANYYWDISRTSGGANADVTFVYGANNFSAENPNAQSDLRLLHWNGSSWDNLGGSGANGEITIGNVSDFSPFTLGTVGAVALPVRPISFVGIRQGNYNRLKWTVMQEKDMRFCEVERSSDGRSFTNRSTITAINGSVDYSYTDNQPLPSINYYRLKIVDNDGRVSYSQTLFLKMNGGGKLEVYPNPAFSRIAVHYPSSGGPLLIRDANGRTVKTVLVGQTGVVSTTVDVSTLPKGMYFISTGKEAASFVKE